MHRIVLPTVVVALAALWQLWASSGANGGWKIGMLNSARLTREVQGFTELRRPYDEQRRAYLELLNLRQNFLLLTGLEWADLRLLLSKPQRTKREEERLQQLRRLELEREVELQRLQQTPSSQMSAQEKARLEELTHLWKEGRADLERLKELMDDELRRAEEAFNKVVDEKMRQAIQKVAEEQSLDLVLEKSVVYFVRGQSVDVTDKVLKALNELVQSEAQQNLKEEKR